MEVCDEVDDECEDSLEEIQKYEHERICEKCLVLNDLILIVEICQLHQILIDEKICDSLEICEIFLDENDDFHDEITQKKNDDLEEIYAKVEEIALNSDFSESFFDEWTNAFSKYHSSKELVSESAYSQ